jgi:hypothetical protein
MREKSPDAQVKFSTPIQHWLLDIFLDDPESVEGSGEDKLLDVFDVSEYLDALPLIHCGRLHKPNVVFTMLEWKALLFTASIVYLFESVLKLTDLMIVGVARH